MDVPRDTTPEAHAVQLEAYRRLGEAGRVQAVFRLNALARAMSLAGIRSRHPEYDDEKAQRAYMRLRLGDELMQKVWPGQALVEP